MPESVIPETVIEAASATSASLKTAPVYEIVTLSPEIKPAVVVAVTLKPAGAVVVPS